MSNICGVLFDKDGTLFDFDATWSAWAFGFLDRLAGGDRTRAEQLGHAIGYDVSHRQFDSASPVIAGTPGEIAELLLPHLPGTTPSALITRMNATVAAAPQVETVPLLPLLGRLRSRGLRLGVATNDAEGPARSHLASAGVSDLFDFIAGFDSGFGAKPQPGQLLGFADAMGLDPASVAMVGDSRHDLLAARAAGMRPVAVLSGLARDADLAPLAEVVLSDIGALPDWIEGAQTRVDAA